MYCSKNHTDIKNKTKSFYSYYHFIFDTKPIYTSFNQTALAGRKKYFGHGLKYDQRSS